MRLVGLFVFKIFRFNADIDHNPYVYQQLQTLQHQYVFLHEAVAEALYLGVKPIKTRDFEAVYTSLLERDKSTGEIGLEEQFLVRRKQYTCTQSR